MQNSPNPLLVLLRFSKMFTNIMLHESHNYPYRKIDFEMFEDFQLWFYNNAAHLFW